MEIWIGEPARHRLVLILHGRRRSRPADCPAIDVPVDGRACGAGER